MVWVTRLNRPQSLVTILSAILLAATLAVPSPPGSGVPPVSRSATKPELARRTIAAGDRERAVREGGVDCNVLACIALTFDDGPSYLTTPHLLDILEREQVSATFFVLGSQIARSDRHPSLLRRTYLNGHEIGNHSWSHASFPKLSARQMQEEVQRTQLAVAAAGLPEPTIFRPPYGNTNALTQSIIPKTIIHWNEDPRDWQAGTAREVAANVIRDAKPGGIVVLHDIRPQTVEAMPAIIQELRARGFQFVTVSHLLDLHPGQTGTFHGRHR